MEYKFPFSTVVGCMFVATVVGFTIGGAVSAFDTTSPEEHIQGWNILHDDIAYRSMGGEDQINLIITYITEGADPRPAWPLVQEMLNDAFATIYASGFVDCQEKCEAALDEVHAAYTMME